MSLSAQFFGYWSIEASFTSLRLHPFRERQDPLHFPVRLMRASQFEGLRHLTDSIFWPIIVGLSGQ
jgi:hypothetical protein